MRSAHKCKSDMNSVFEDKMVLPIDVLISLREPPQIRLLHLQVARHHAYLLCLYQRP